MMVNFTESHTVLQTKLYFFYKTEYRGNEVAPSETPGSNSTTHDVVGNFIALFKLIG